MPSFCAVIFDWAYLMGVPNKIVVRHWSVACFRVSANQCQKFLVASHRITKEWNRTISWTVHLKKEIVYSASIVQALWPILSCEMFPG